LNYEARTNDFSIILGEKDSMEVLNNHTEQNWKITFAETGLDSMTGTRIKRIQKYIEPGESFMLTYGDGLSNVDLDGLISFHKSHNKALTLTGVRPAGRFGEIMSDSKGEITEFKEKPEATKGRINGGFFVASYSLFDYINGSRNDIIFEQEPMNKLVEAKQLMQFDHDGFWQPMDTMREYKMLNEMYLEKNAPWRIWE
jgi:glucose-1-phosphate cytidylyltransferase